MYGKRLEEYWCQVESFASTSGTRRGQSMASFEYTRIILVSSNPSRKMGFGHFHMFSGRNRPASLTTRARGLSSAPAFFPPMRMSPWTWNTYSSFEREALGSFLQKILIGTRASSRRPKETSGFHKSGV